MEKAPRKPSGGPSFFRVVDRPYFRSTPFLETLSFSCVSLKK